MGECRVYGNDQSVRVLPHIAEGINEWSLIMDSLEEIIIPLSRARSCCYSVYIIEC